jgi:pectinesterase
MKIEAILSIVILFGFITEAVAESADLIVAKDGSGDFTTIQEAINSVPANNTSLIMILIKNGIYNEEIRIDTDFIALVGEDRDSTRIEYFKPYNWDSTYVDVGRAVINIYANDIILANLTVENTQPEVGIHAFTVYGNDNNRTIIINCNILSNGGDTLALWNGETGMYYHNMLYLKGAVDFLCPRGWCYADNIEFYCTRSTTPLWHDGSKDEDQKFVVKNSNFDGASTFNLGRNHLDGAFYLLNLVFSEKLNDNPFELPASAPGPYTWGERYYFNKCTRPAGDYTWFQDNMITAKDSPKPEEVTAAWTFAGMWDPEATMPSVLPMSFLPKPDNKEIRVTLTPELTWVPGRNAESHNIYFGTTNPPVFVGNTTERSYIPGTLVPNTTYYWRIDVVESDSTIEGKIWRFHTIADHLPPKAIEPFPADQAVDVTGPVERLSWKVDSLSTELHYLYFGEHADSLKLISSYSIPGYFPEPLYLGRTYFWRVDLENHLGTTTGDIWQFRMEESKFEYADYMQQNDDEGIVSIEVEDFTDSTIIGEHTWHLVTDPTDYSAQGAMQTLPDNGYFVYTNYLTKCSRLDFSVDFVKAGTHYIWIRAYSNNSGDNAFHVGLNLEENKNATRIGNFDNTGQWEWIHRLASINGEPRTFEVKALGIQRLSLWYAKDGAIADKIILTTNPDYVPTGYGPDVTVGVESETNLIKPKKFQLDQNYPNPFNPKTIINYALRITNYVDLSVYNLIGQKVATLVSEKQPAGVYNVEWNASEFATGIYYYQIITGEFRDVKKMILIR